MTVKQLLTDNYPVLSAAQRPDADILLADVLRLSLAGLYARPERNVGSGQLRKFKKYLKARARGYSVAAIVGYKYFFGLKFLVSADTLIPRPESELMVETALNLLAGKPGGEILDIGTGSGNLIISIAHTARKARHTYTAIDASKAALKIATANARRHQVKIKFIESDLWAKLPVRPYRIIMANLPYLKTSQLSEPSIKREPKRALWGGRDGLQAYRRLLPMASNYLAPGGTLLMEIDPTQKKTLIGLANRYLPDSRIWSEKDLAGLDRLIIARMPGPGISRGSNRKQLRPS